jgi:hypothetical protein
MCKYTSVGTGEPGQFGDHHRQISLTEVRPQKKRSNNDYTKSSSWLSNRRPAIKEAFASNNNKDWRSQTMTTANDDDVVVACCMVIGVVGHQRGKCRCPTPILECATNAGNAHLSWKCRRFRCRLQLVLTTWCRVFPTRRPDTADVSATSCDVGFFFSVSYVMSLPNCRHVVVVTTH